MSIKAAFLMDEVSIPLERLLPSRALPPGIKQSPRYLMIESSVREVGIIEPPIVYPQEGKEKDRMYLLLEGHLRVEVLRDLGRTHVDCLVATDDENCTYNHHISGLAPIQEIRMIRKAVADGVPEERIAKALNVSVRTIRETETKLDGICAEAIEVLKDKPIVDRALEALKKVKPYRQVEMAELMRMANMYSEPHAKALLAANPDAELPEPAKRPQLATTVVEQRAAEGKKPLEYEPEPDDEKGYPVTSVEF